MEKRIDKVNYEIMAFDLENTVDEESIKNKETRMWLGSLIGEESKVDDDDIYSFSIKELVDKLEEKTKTKRTHRGGKPKQKNLLIYIWNLSHEWSFIFPELIRRGFKPGKVSSKKGSPSYVYSSVTNRSVSSVWQAEIKFGSYDGIVVFRDLAKLLGGSLKRAAQSYGTKTQKGDEDGKLIDYTAPRPEGYIPNATEKFYCFNDTRIIIEILQKIDESGDPYFWRSTSSASWSARRMITEAYSGKAKPITAYRKEYPFLDDAENEFIRKSISGGLCYVANPDRFQNKNINQPVFHIDAHQMHPSQMYYQYFPYGKGTYFKGCPTPIIKANKISCLHIKVSYTGVKLHSIIKLINHGGEFAEGIELYVWDFEIPLMFRCYEDLEIEYIDGYYYDKKKLPWRELLASNYRNRMKCKQTGDKAGDARYKLFNNSFYGKMLENAHNDKITNIINDSGFIDTVVTPEGNEKMTRNCGKYAYIPLGSCIPAYSRVALISTALLFNYRDIIYFDTDSIFILYNENTRKVWETSPKINKENFFGGWGLEGENGLHYKMRAVCPKRYITENSKGIKDVKCAGVKPSELFQEQAINAGYLSADEKDQEIIDSKVQEFLKNTNVKDLKLDNIKIKCKQRMKAKGGYIIYVREKFISAINVLMCKDDLDFDDACIED